MRLTQDHWLLQTLHARVPQKDHKFDLKNRDRFPKFVDQNSDGFHLDSKVLGLDSKVDDIDSKNPGLASKVVVLGSKRPC